jgi:hypothetical protein
MVHLDQLAVPIAPKVEEAATRVGLVEMPPPLPRMDASERQP